MRALLSDSLFPNKYAKWRLVETRSFINKWDTDILVPVKTVWYEIPFVFDYKELRESHSLDRYDLLIFNPKWNHLNQYNSSDFDGREWNSKFPYDYMFRLKKYRGEPLDFSKYDIVYHIFLGTYFQFNANSGFFHTKQYIHAYPGGGIIDPGSLAGINPKVRL